MSAKNVDKYNRFRSITVTEQLLFRDCPSRNIAIANVWSVRW